MSRNMVLYRIKHAVICACFLDGKLEDIRIAPADTKDFVGTIYVGKVQNIVKNIHGAFVELSDKKTGYLSLDEVENPIFLNKKKQPEIKTGDEILVQMVREPLKMKQAGLSANISVNGSYLVLSTGKTKIGVSAKIKDKRERERLSKILSQMQNQPTEDDDVCGSADEKDAVHVPLGIVARTNAKGVGESVLIREYQELQNELYQILNRAGHAICYSRVYVPRPSYLDFAFDSNSGCIDLITTDDALLYSEVVELYETHGQMKKPKIMFYEDKLLPMSRYYSLNTSISQCLKKQVWLKSGAYLVIEPTEALTVIDVNTGKAITGKRIPEETFHKINLEAAREIARQIRLRNLSGIILIDFIDMKQEENQADLLNQLRAFFQEDPVKTILVDQTKLQLVEVTRMKIQKPLYEEMKQLDLLDGFL